MLSSGPFLLTSGTLFSTTDPTWTQPCAVAVQIQNSSGFLIQASIGGVQYLIQPFSASTVPTNKTPYLSILPSFPQANFGVLISFAWLQPGESPPMADGPLTAGATQSLGLLSVTITAPDSLAVAVLGAPPIGFVYSLYSVNDVSGGVSSAAYTIGNPSFSIVYYETAGVAPLLQLLGGIIADTAVDVETALPGAGYPATVTLRYDLFPQPIS